MHTINLVDEVAAIPKTQNESKVLNRMKQGGDAAQATSTKLTTPLATTRESTTRLGSARAMRY